MYCVKSPFTLIVIPGLTEPAPYSIRGNPVFPIWISGFPGMTKNLSGFVAPAEAGIQWFRFFVSGFPF